MTPAASVLTPLIELDGVAFEYRLAGGETRPVLSDVDLAVGTGEFVALIGTNGSGKTTLLRLLAGTLTPSRGAVSYLGRPIGSLSRAQVARKIAVLPQSLELPSGFRVAELVEMGRAPHARGLFGTSADDHRVVRRALVEAGALHLADRYAAELSGGERQRVVFAMALAQEPELLLLDEPTLHLDLAHQVALLDAVASLRERRSVTVVAVFHDLNLAAAFAPRVAVLDDGRIAADGPPEKILTAPLVARVFGVTIEELRTSSGARHLALNRARA